MTEGIFKQPQWSDAADVVCPECHAGVGGACLEKVQPQGRKYIDYFHVARIAKAEELKQSAQKEAREA